MKHLIVDVLLTLAVALCWLGALGVLRLRTAYDRLHMTGYVVMGAGSLFTLALIVSQPWSQVAVKALLIFAALAVTGGLLTHSTGRALRIRDESGDAP